MREHAIIEERERIARELHDGLSQLLGYINTKANAVRLLLSKWQIRIAENQLLQLEEAAQGLFLDVREAIIGLKVSGRVGDNMANTLQECTRSFSRLSDIPIEVDIDPQVEALTFDAETELHLLRIVQILQFGMSPLIHTLPVHIWLKSRKLNFSIGRSGSETAMITGAEC